MIWLASCTKQEAMLSLDEQARADSAALHVAVMPTLGNLPVYFADRSGLWDTLGLDVRLLRYEAQIDIDTALIGRHAEVGASDLIRALRLYDRETPVRALFTTTEPITLVAVKGKRVSKIHQLKERMIAISRLCITDYWCDQFIDTLGTGQPDYYRPQVHNVKVRADMLRTGLMDAAMLPEPYTMWMAATGNVLLQTSTDKDPQLSAWIALSEALNDSARSKQIALFTEAYRMAVERINEGVQADLVNDILCDEYGLPQEVADSIQLPTLNTEGSPQRTDIDKAIEWLKGRQRMPKDVKTDSLFMQ